MSQSVNIDLDQDSVKRYQPLHPDCVILNEEDIIETFRVVENEPDLKD